VFATLQAHSGITAFLRRKDVRKHLRIFLRPNASQFVAVGALTLVTTAIPVAIPLIYRHIFNILVFSPHPLKGIFAWAGVVAALGLVNGGLSIVLSRASLRLGYGLIADLQAALYDKFQRMPIGFFARAKTGAILSRLTNEVNAAESMLSTNLVSIVRSVLTLVGASVVLAFVNYRLLVLLVLVAPSLWFVRRQTRLALSRAYESFQLFAEMSVRAEQHLNVSGATVVKLYGDAEHELSRFVRVADRLRDCMVAIRERLLNLDAAINTLGVLAMAGALAGGGWLVTRHQLNIGTLVLLLFYVGIVQQPMSVLATSRLEFARSLAAMERVFEVLEFDVPTAPIDATGQASLRRGIEFSDVCFRYPDPGTVMIPSLGQVVEASDDSDFELRNVSFVAPAGRIVALVGATGSGKSTIAALAAGLYVPDSGNVWVDGVPASGGSIDVPRPSVAFVTQDAYLFHDTIRENIIFGLGDVSDRDLIDACKAAQIHERLHNLPAGYNTIAGERGARLSGGERQRIAIARAILRRPSVVILDEATAHLDNITEAALSHALTEVFADTARLVIAHRLSTVAAADEILVIDGGRITEVGTHQTLIEAGGSYAQLHAAYLTSA